VIQGKLKGLRGRFLLLVVSIYLLVGAASLFGFYSVAESIIQRLGIGYATQYANQQRSRILAKVQRELVLTQKLASSPLLRRWARDESNPDLKRESLEELESFRRIFADHSWFFAIHASDDYYTNNAKNEFGGHEFRFVEKVTDPTMQWYFATLEHVDDFDLHVDYDASSTSPRSSSTRSSRTMRATRPALVELVWIFRSSSRTSCVRRTRASRTC